MCKLPIELTGAINSKQAILLIFALCTSIFYTRLVSISNVKFQNLHAESKTKAQSEIAQQRAQTE